MDISHYLCKFHMIKEKLGTTRGVVGIPKHDINKHYSLLFAAKKKKSKLSLVLRRKDEEGDRGTIHSYTTRI